MKFYNNFTIYFIFNDTGTVTDGSQERKVDCLGEKSSINGVQAFKEDFITIVQFQKIIDF